MPVQILLQLSLASPLKKISTKPTQHDEAVETEKTDSASTSLASPLKKINTDEKKIITPSKIICCKDDTSTSSDSASTSLASPLKKISKPTQHDEAVETEKTDSASTSLASPLKKIVLNRPNTMKQLKQRKPILLQPLLQAH